MTKLEFVRENGIDYQIINGEKIRRSYDLGNMEMLLSKGMSIEEQVCYMAWKSELRN